MNVGISNPFLPRALFLFQGLPGSITSPLSACGQFVILSRKPDTKSHNSGNLRAVGNQAFNHAVAAVERCLI